MGRKLINEIGNKYGRLRVIRQATEQEYPRGTGKPIRWLCQCECGNTTFADGRDLRNGSRVSCGCQNREKASLLCKQLGDKNLPDLIGQKFGKLTVISLKERGIDSKGSHNYTIWNCKCDCGNIIPVRTNYLLSKHTTSCGCNRNTVNGGPSKGEELIKTILLKEQIPFQREYICKDLRNNLYRFDFYLPQSFIAIEYNGVQHYEYTSFFYKTRADFLKAQERDRIKIAYSLANNISLYVIPFWEFNNLKTSKDIFNEKFLPNDKFFNDTLWREHQKNRHA